MGHSQQRQGAAAEKVILESARCYGPSRVSLLHLPIMFRQIGPRKYIRARPSPFDFMGWCRMGGWPIPVGIELKSNATMQTRMPIVAPKAPGQKGGSGVQFHQLQALAEYHEQGCLALALWRNGDRWYRLGGAILAGLYQQYTAALASRAAPQKSIRLEEWTRIHAIDYPDPPTWVQFLHDLEDPNVERPKSAPTEDALGDRIVAGRKTEEPPADSS